MKELLKVAMIPLAFAAIIIMIFSGITTFVLLVKLCWNLIFHEVSKEMMLRCGCSILIFIAASAISAVYNKITDDDE